MADPDLFEILHKLYVMRGCAKRMWFAKFRLPHSILAQLLADGYVYEQDDTWLVDVQKVVQRWPRFARTEDAAYWEFIATLTDGRIHAVRDLIRAHKGARRMLEDALNLHHVYVIGSCPSGRIFALTPEGALLAQSIEKELLGDDRPKT